MPAEKPSFIQTKIRKTIRYYLDNKPDAMFGFLRRVKPNISLGPIGFVTRFEDVQEALMLPEIFRVTYAPMMDPSVGPFMLARDNTTINQRDKGIMLTIMSRDDLPKVRNKVREITANLLGDLKGQKQLELVSEVARVCPVLFMQQHFGFEGASIAQMQQWSMATQMDMFHNPNKRDDIHQANIDAGKQMHVHLSALLDEKRQELKQGISGDDVFSKLVSTHFPEAVGFGDEQIITNIMGLLVGGIETTAQAVVQILDELFKRPKVLNAAIDAAKADDQDLLFRYCWEALRFNPINTVVVRHCVADYTLAKSTFRRHTFKAGTTVLISTRSAMKDKKQIPCPNDFCIDRPAHHYMHTGYGLHTCLGDQINKVQMPEIVRGILLLPNLRQASPMEIGEGGFPSKLEIVFD